MDKTVYDRYNNSKIIKDNLQEECRYSFYGALWVSDKHIKKGIVTKDLVV